MTRVTGSYQSTIVGSETVKAFVPHPLPPSNPPLFIEGELAALHDKALAAIGQLAVAGAMVPNTNWVLYGFVRKEAVISSQIEGTQATLMDVLTFEATHKAERPTDVEEVCNYLDALANARAEIVKPDGMPLCTRLLCAAHERLMRGTRGADKQPGVIRTSQNWIGGSRPGNALFVPPPHQAVPEALAHLERWVHSEDSLPPLVRAGLAHVQFETIHPFLDGNGRIGRLFIALLLEHWGILKTPLLYLSLAFKRHRAEYYQHLLDVRTQGDWEGWMKFYLRCLCESAEDGVGAARRLCDLVGRDRRALTRHKAATVTAIRLLDLLPEHVIVTLPRVIQLLKMTKPTAGKAIDALCDTGILHETTGRQRDRVYAYTAYLKVLAEDTAVGQGGDL